jgi:hypothetical protein
MHFIAHFFCAGTALAAGAADALAEGAAGASTAADAEAVVEGTASADTEAEAEAAALDLSSDLQPIRAAAQQNITNIFFIVFSPIALMARVIIT